MLSRREEFEELPLSEEFHKLRRSYGRISLSDPERFASDYFLANTFKTLEINCSAIPVSSLRGGLVDVRFGELTHRSPDVPVLITVLLASATGSFSFELPSDPDSPGFHVCYMFRPSNKRLLVCVSGTLPAPGMAKYYTYHRERLRSLHSFHGLKLDRGLHCKQGSGCAHDARRWLACYMLITLRVPHFIIGYLLEPMLRTLPQFQPLGSACMWRGSKKHTDTHVQDTTMIKLPQMYKSDNDSACAQTCACRNGECARGRTRIRTT